MPTIARNADGDFDLVCERCGFSSRLHPGESVVPQVELFLAQHTCEPGDVAPPP